MPKTDPEDETIIVTEEHPENDGPTQVVETYHRVAPGETWEVLAETYDTTVEALLALNAAHPLVHGPEAIPVNAEVRVR